jgi:hypothetical protein
VTPFVATVVLALPAPTSSMSVGLAPRAAETIPARPAVADTLELVETDGLYAAAVEFAHPQPGAAESANDGP